MDEELLQALQDYVATANSGKYKTVDELNSKFPELKNYDTQVLQDYVATANSGKYKTIEELNLKFPEFNVGKQGAVSLQGSENTAIPSTEPSQPFQISNGEDWNVIEQQNPLPPVYDFNQEAITALQNDKLPNDKIDQLKEKEVVPSTEKLDKLQVFGEINGKRDKPISYDEWLNLGFFNKDLTEDLGASGKFTNNTWDFPAMYQHQTETGKYEITAKQVRAFTRPYNPIYSTDSVYFTGDPNDGSVSKWQNDGGGDWSMRIGTLNRTKNDLKDIVNTFYDIYPNQTLIDTDGEVLIKDGEPYGKAVEALDGNALGYLYNKTLSGVDSIIQGVTRLAQLTKYAPQTFGQLGELISEENVESAGKLLKDNIGVDIETLMQNRYENNLATSLVGGLAQSAPAMLAGEASIPLMIIQSYNDTYNDINSSEEGKNLDEGVKNAYSLIQGTTQGLLEKWGLSQIFGKGNKGGAITRGIIDKVLGKVEKGASEKVIVNEINQEVKGLANRIAKFGIGVANAYVTEFETGALQTASDLAGKLAINKGTGKNVFDTTVFNNPLGFIGETIKGGGFEGLGGSLLGAIRETGVAFKNIKKDNYESKLNGIRESLKDPNLSESSRQTLLTSLTNIEEQKETQAKELTSLTNKLNPAEKSKIEKEISELSNINSTLLDDKISNDVKETLKERKEELVNVVGETLKNLEIEVSKEEVNIKENAIQEPSTTQEIPRIGEAGKGIQESGERMGQGEQGQEITQETQTKEEINIPEIGNINLNENLPSEKIKPVVDYIRSLKSGQKLDKLSSGDIIGVVNFFRDGALETIATVIETGGSIADGISSAINYIREQQLKNNEKQNSVEELRPIIAKELLGITEVAVQTKSTQQQIKETTGTKRIPKNTPLVGARKEGKYEGQLQYGEKLGKAKEQIKNLRKETSEKIRTIRESNRTDKAQAISKIKETLNEKTQELKVVYGQTINELKDTMRESIKQERGKAKEQLDDYKTQQATIKDVVAEIKSEISRLISQAKKDKILTGNVKAFKATNLFNVLNKATTPSQVIKALEYAEKYISDTEYDNKIVKAKSLQEKINKLSNRKNVPVDLKTTLKQISKVNISKLENIDNTIETLDNIANILARPYILQTGEARNSIEQGNAIVKKYNVIREEEIQSDLKGAGVPENEIKLLTTSQQGTLLAKINEELGFDEKTGELNEPKPRKVEQYRTTAKTLQSLIEEYVDNSEMSEQQKSDVENIKNIDIDKVAEKYLAQLVFGLTNLVNTNSTVGLGRIVITDRVIKKSEDNLLISRVKDNIRDATNFFTKRFQRFRTGSNKIANAIRNEREVGVFNDVFGLTNFKLGSIEYNKSKTKIINKLTELRAKNSKAFKDPIKSMMLSIYSDAAQFKLSMTPEEIIFEYNNRIIAWGKSLDKLKKKSKQSTKFEKDNRIFIENAEEALYKIATFERDNDGNIESVNIKLSKDILFQELGKPHQEYYKAIREEFDRIKDDYFRVSQYYNNKNLDLDIENYMFRGYRQISQPQSDLSLDAANEVKRLKANASGSSEGRINWGSSLPSDSVLDFDLMGRVETDISRMLYDVHTLEARIYAAQATDVLSSPIVEKLDTSDIAETYNEILEIATQQDAFQFGGNSVNKSDFVRIVSLVNRIGVSNALFGLSQSVKQLSPLFDTAVRLKNPLTIISGLQNLLEKSENVENLLSYANVSTRNILQDISPINVNVRKRKLHVKALTKALRKIGATAEQIVEVTSTIAGKPLQMTDKTVASASWMAFYIDHLQDKGKDVQFEKLDREAFDYADLMTSNVNNESDPRFKASITQNQIFKLVAPFMGFGTNNKMDLLNSLSKIGNGNSADVTRNILGNLTGMLAYNTISYAVRAIIWSGTVFFARELIKHYTDDEGEQEKLAKVLNDLDKEKSETSYINYKKYLIRDAIFANISSESLDLVVNPVTDGILYLTTEEDIYKKYKKNIAQKYEPNDYEKAIKWAGVATPAFSRAGDVYKLSKDISESDQDFIKKRKGQINAEGTDIIVDDYYNSEQGIKENSRPKASKVIDMLSMLSTVVSLTGLSYQEATSFRRSINTIDKKFVESLRGKGSDKEKALKDYLDIQKVNFNNNEDGVSYEVELSNEMQDKLSKYIQEEVKSLKKDMSFKGYKNYFTKTEYEQEIGKISRENAKVRLISENADYFGKQTTGKNNFKKLEEREKVIKFQNKE